MVVTLLTIKAPFPKLREARRRNVYGEEYFLTETCVQYDLQPFQLENLIGKKTVTNFLGIGKRYYIFFVYNRAFGDGRVPRFRPHVLLAKAG